MSDQDIPTADTAGPYAVFLPQGYGVETGEANLTAALGCFLGLLGLAMLVSAGFTGSFLTFAASMAVSVLGLVAGMYGLSVVESAGRGRACAIVGMSSSGLTIAGSASLAVFAVMHTT